MLALLVTIAALNLRPLPAHCQQRSTRILPSRAGLIYAELDSALKVEFVELLASGGTCVQEGDMGKALGYFKRALAIDPTSETTKVMVARLEAKGFMAEDEDGTIDVMAGDATPES